MTNLFEQLFLFLAICVLATGCGTDSPDSESEANGKPRIVATTTMLADMARQIVGDEAEVIGLMAPGVDPHTYELPARAIGQLNSADLVIYNGMLLEGKMEELIESLNSKGIETFAAADSLQEEDLFTSENLDDGHGDPHVWGDVMLWIDITAEALRPIQSVVASELAMELKGNSDKYINELAELDAWIRTRIEEVPETERLLVTSHDAFNYLGRAYNIEVVGVQGISTAADAGIADIVSTVDLIKERKAKAIFVESSVSPAAIERIAKDAGVKIGGELFSDSCGPDGEIEAIDGTEYDLGTYVGMMKHNINTIVEALK